MARGAVILVVFAFTVVGQALTPSTYLTTVDQARLRAVFEAAQPYSELSSAHYSIMGLKLLGASVPNAKETCSFVQSKLDVKSVESIFYASSISKALGSCKLTAANAKQLLTESIKGESKVLTIYQAFFALKNLALAVDSNTVSAALLESLKTDDSPTSNGYAFYVASQLDSDVKQLYDLIEDVIAQADEVDNKYYQFEAGLYTTALVLDGAYRLGEKAKKAPTINDERVVKFTNYLLSRKHVQQLRSAAQLVSVVKTLASNKYHIPIAVSLAGPVAVSVSSPNVQVKVTNLMGESVGTLTVTADSGKNLRDDAVVLNKKPLKASKSDSSLFEMNLMDTKPKHGFYRITLSVAPQKPDNRLIGTSGAVVKVKVTTKVSVENVELGVGDRDQGAPTKMTKLQHPSKAASVLEADTHQKLVMKFNLKDKTSGDLMTAHQVFVRFTHHKTKQELVFVAETEKDNMYKFDLDVGSKVKEFGSLSGKYSMELIVGDAVVENPFAWHLADVSLSFPDAPPTSKEKNSLYAAKPEIKHLFREPEKRPPAVVSNAFTVLVLFPLVILFGLWLKLGVNVTNFPVSLSAIGFHLGLAAIFILFYCYWVYLNMFETLRYLAMLGLPTFLFGNRLLSGIAANKK